MKPLCWAGRRPPGEGHSGRPRCCSRAVSRAGFRLTLPVCAPLRRALRDALRRLLGLFGETLKAAVALKSRIGERVGLCLEDESPPAGERRQPCARRPEAGHRGSSWQHGSCVCSLVAPALDEVWPGLDAALPELDSASPECAETSSVAEISSHVCESFFMSPESTLEYERPVRRIYRSLGLAVDGLLEMVLDSTRQVRHGPSASLQRRVTG